MSTITHPAITPNQFAMVPVPNVRQHRSPYSGILAGVDLIGSPWRFTMGYPSQDRSDGRLQAYFNRLHGSANNTSLWDMQRPAPRGTMRGTPTLASSVAQGATSLSIQSIAGATLQPGDKLGLSQMLFEVADPVVFDGSGLATVNVTTRVRKAVTSGTAVAWDKPTVLAVLNGDGIVPLLYGINGSDVVQAEYLEAW